MKELVGDSWDYDLISLGVELSKDVDGICLEIGLRLGGGTKHIVDAISNHCPNKVAMAIDPYGYILYELKQDTFVRLDYTEDMKCTCLSNLYQYVKEKKVHFIFHNLEDTEFFNRYSDGVPVYNNHKTIVNKYSFVHFDGCHSVGALIKEIDFFLPRTDSGAFFCFDDISEIDYYYNHSVIEEYLLKNNFVIHEKRDKKGLYKKI